MKYRYAAYVSGGSTVKKIITNGMTLSRGLKLVVSDSPKGAQLADCCAQNGITLFVCDFLELPGIDRNQTFSDIMCGLFDEMKIDYCFSFGSHLLRKTIVDKYHGRLINLHPGLLPNYKGLNAIDKALANGEAYLGNTAHFIDEGMDSGEIIMQRKVDSALFYKEGYDGVLNVQLDMIDEIVSALESDSLKEKFSLKTV